MTHPPTHDDPDRVPGAARTIRFAVYVAAVSAVVAVLLAAVALATGGGIFAWIAAIAASLAAVYWSLSGLGRNASRRVRREGSVVTVEMRRAWPASAALGSAVLTAFLGQAALDPWFEPTLRLAAGGCALMLLVPLPDLVRAAVTGGHVVIRPDRIEVSTWSSRAVLDWDDVTYVDLDLTIKSRPAVRIRARPGAPAPIVGRRRILIPLEPRHPEGCVVINALALDEPWLFTSWLDDLVGRTPQDRAHRIETVTFDVLRSRWPRPA